ncbi:hypothetical protein ACFQJC_17105 [Haloferax namakaokahaiae]|uniref:Restriction endonuclease n=1 Tax=Haloferax namakaokahaiae TaxID=1748331 RepID=A0ABD5ZIV2_9EURY
MERPSDRSCNNRIAVEIPQSFETSRVDSEWNGHIKKVSREEANFLATLFDIFNFESNYPIELPMNEYLIPYFKNEISDSGARLNVNSLEERGYIESEQISLIDPVTKKGTRGVWYNPSRKASPAVYKTKRTTPTVKTAGEDYAHRLMIHLLKKYFYTLNEVDKVETYKPFTDGEYYPAHVVDVIAYDKAGTPIHIGEAESLESRSSADIARKYQRMAESPADAWWIVSKQKALASIFRVLSQCDEIPDYTQAEVLSASRARDYIKRGYHPGLTQVIHIKELYQALAGNQRIEKVV